MDGQCVMAWQNAAQYITGKDVKEKTTGRCIQLVNVLLEKKNYTDRKKAYRFRFLAFN